MKARQVEGLFLRTILPDLWHLVEVQLQHSGALFPSEHLTPPRPIPPAPVRTRESEEACVATPARV
ncbi:hypothetical protein E2C01_007039 [Portunus trituberculatus]|uniref:Uncharacterized protein n=1 Tax=Portunus trituberculatus TaxID=210409 RepID=A0A5B7D1A9_PORTR|nr:hypothetical protein [Portunus trituberculatus]